MTRYIAQTIEHSELEAAAESCEATILPERRERLRRELQALRLHASEQSSLAQAALMIEQFLRDLGEIDIAAEFHRLIAGTA